MVKAKALTPEALIEAMEAGQFYASTGVVLNDVSVHDYQLTVSVKPEPGVDYTIEFIDIGGDQPSTVLKKVTGTVGDFRLNGRRLIRARITSTKKKDNPYQEGDFEMAWTQPVK